MIEVHRGIERVKRRRDLAGVFDRAAGQFGAVGERRLAELACSAIKHAGEIPPAFDALDAAVYLDYGPAFAVEWAERTVDALA